MTHGENIARMERIIRRCADAALPGCVYVGYCGLSEVFGVFLRDKGGVWRCWTTIDLHHPKEHFEVSCKRAFEVIAEKLKEQDVDWDAELKRLERP